jgi:ABC-2 type transport system permease protein
MRSIFTFFIRTSAFVQKELVEILRQTRLMLALVLGPFLILLLFGLGFRDEARELRALFVVSANEPSMTEAVREHATTLGPQLDFRGIVTNQGQAMAYLARGEVDAVVIVPDNAEQRIRNNEQPTVELYHREIDPFQVNYVQYVAQIYVDELNRRVLRTIAEEGQQEAADVQSEIQTARMSARMMREAFDRGDADEAQRQRGQVNRSLGIVSLGVGASLGVLQGVEDTMNPRQEDEERPGSAGAILRTIDTITQNNRELEDTSPNQTSYGTEVQRAREIEEDLDRLDEQLADFRSVDPHVLVSPFRAEAVNVNYVELNSSEFFAPGVIVLLLQHLLITFAALSIVRERRNGTMELFRVAPITPFETLLGKYLSYLFIGALLAVGISALVVLVLQVPMLGNWLNFALVLLALMFASLGIGFVISLLSETTSQAVQYSMLVLLFSIFFSGFFLDLRLMWESIRFIAWGIPATYGMQMLQEIMFRANPPRPLLLGGLAGIGLLFFIISWIMLRQQMKIS